MSEQPKSQNDRAWEALFERYQILSHIEGEGKFFISAAQIKEYREPRLMAKFDHRSNLPRIFAANRLAILPVSRGDYVVSHFEAYQPFEESSSPAMRAHLPAHLQSLDAGNIPSEAIALNCALASGMLADFLGEDTLYPTVSGRMGSGQFSFCIRNSCTEGFTQLSVNNSQIEIDAAFEGTHSLALIEAKRDLSEDFLVRQLYYPFRAWRERVAKQVRPVFLVYSNGIFRLYEYEFRDPDCYNSLVLLRQKKYSIEDTGIRRADLADALKRAMPGQEPKISFPQANRFARVVNLCELLAARKMDREQVTEEYDFDIRQTNYYTDAARYLGLVEKQYGEGRRPVYSLSGRGRRILGLPYRQRQMAFCEAILEHGAFRETFRISLERGCVPDTGEIVRIMQGAGLYKVESHSTFARRASTISGWVNWMMGLICRQDEGA